MQEEQRLGMGIHHEDRGCPAATPILLMQEGHANSSRMELESQKWEHLSIQGQGQPEGHLKCSQS